MFSVRFNGKKNDGGAVDHVVVVNEGAKLVWDCVEKR